MNTCISIHFSLHFFLWCQSAPLTKKWRMFRSAPFLFSKSLIMKPLSARTKSPLCNLSISPDCIVISRAEIEHSNASDINPKVVWLSMKASRLCTEKNGAIYYNNLIFWICLKRSGIFFFICEADGRHLRSIRLNSRPYMHESDPCDDETTLVSLISNIFKASCLCKSPSLRRINVNISSFCGVIIRLELRLFVGVASSSTCFFSLPQ